jgi:transcriptional regulator with XRE-family HTH domain
MSNRIEEMKRLRKEKNWSLDKIGVFFGISRQRVFQILGKDGNYFTSYHTEKARDFLSLDQSKTTSEIRKETGKINVNWHGLRHKLDGKSQKLGAEIEVFISDLLKKKGIPNNLTNGRKVDIVLGNGKTIEVKSRSKTHANKFSENFYYFPVLRNSEKKADFYILVILKQDEKAVFVIPRNEVPEHGGIGFVYPPRKNSKNWVVYKDRFDLLTQEL